MNRLILSVTLSALPALAFAVPPSVPAPEFAGLGLLALGVTLAVILRKRNR
jgi:hypothetical protein